MNRNPLKPAEVYPEDIPYILKDYFDLAGTNKFPQKHRHYAVCKFYNELNNGQIGINNIPSKVLYFINEIYHIVFMADQLSKTNKRKELARCNEILTLVAEAQIASHYKQKGYTVKWLSVFDDDPPDLMVSDSHLSVDIEVKIKDETFKLKNSEDAIKAIFKSLSKGLQSLKNGKHSDNPAVVAVHADKDLYWPDWLSNGEVIKRLESRLCMDEYKIISGIVFSGGKAHLCLREGMKCGTKLVAYRSKVAAKKLPIGFLPSLNGSI